LKNFVTGQQQCVKSSCWRAQSCLSWVCKNVLNTNSKHNKCYLIFIKIWIEAYKKVRKKRFIVPSCEFYIDRLNSFDKISLKRNSWTEKRLWNDFNFNSFGVTRSLNIFTFFVWLKFQLSQVLTVPDGIQ
jgi:hypothetical protein